MNASSDQNVQQATEAAVWKERQREAVARAICKSCDENPDHRGDARGNAHRWQDYLDTADAAILAMQSTTGGPIPVAAYLTTDEEGSPAMLFFDCNEARGYCDDDEEPIPLCMLDEANRRLADK